MIEMQSEEERRRCFASIDLNAKLARNRPIKKARTFLHPLQVITVGMDQSKFEVQVLTTNTLYGLVDIAFEIFNPRKNGDKGSTHPWNLWIQDKLKFKSTHAKVVKVEEVAEELKQGDRFTVEYSYGNATTYHEFYVTAIEDGLSFVGAKFPRRKPTQLRHRRPGRPRRKKVEEEEEEEAPDSPTQVQTRAVPPPPPPILIDLNEEFPALSKWCFRLGHVKELNFFQAGKHKVYGYLETYDQQMIMVPETANSLGHYLEGLERASLTPRGSMGWHSIIVLPQKNPHKELPKRLDAFQKDLEAGFCDCHVVPDTTTTDMNLNLNATFPKLAAFGGFRRDKHCSLKGWLRYKDRVLQLVQGTGSPVLHPNSPKGTAFHGEGTHVPALPEKDVLAEVNFQCESLQDLFLQAERLLGTLL